MQHKEIKARISTTIQESRTGFMSLARVTLSAALNFFFRPKKRVSSNEKKKKTGGQRVNYKIYLVYI